ncbi:MAG: 3-phosphoserine/phosphohydroxythreonine transaminase [Bradymonadales bacterium]|jgi:phosphoserine aminotransferase
MKSKKKFYFSPGPVKLPEPVLARAQAAITGFGEGPGILELSHRSSVFEEILSNTESKFRKLGGISEDYAVLFLQGGATQQFWQLPAALASDASIDVIHTGFWCAAAMRDAKPYTRVRLAFDGASDNYSRIPEMNEISCDPEARYLYYCSNNSFCGTQWQTPPKLGLPLVGDLSSDIFSRRLDLGGHAAVFASAQKNLGCAGLCVVVILRSFLQKYQKRDLPALQDYLLLDRERSMLNTPPIFSIYVMGLMLDWIEGRGGLLAMERENRRKASVIWGAIDESAGFYQHDAALGSRSMTNICFRCKNSDMDALFVEAAQRKGLWSLAGHRSRGGIRASIFNVVSLEACEELANFMREFAKRSSFYH